ncbi:hypothetical protein [Fluviicola sp.]|uniref:hypothetical protein n=1 Tax=Fluviicola sp. TaxID=1917219 RepID=UPI00260839C2|nr:hypothetical protein [Fluviicola sp.]
MKKILIISYYFPPCVGIAPNRPAAFANDFSKFHDVKVVTRHWLGNENKWEDYLKSNPSKEERIQQNKYLEIIQVPYQSKVQKPNTLKTFFDLLRGKLDPEIDATQLLPAASEIAANWKPDLILVSTPPINLVQVAYLLHKKFKIPFIVDFRDFENDTLLNKNKKLRKWDNPVFQFREFHVIRWLKKSSAIATINTELQSYFIRKTQKETALVFNGFENSLFDQFVPLQELRSDRFIISIVGTIYQGQEYELFLEAFQKVLPGRPEILFKFIGTDTIPEIGDQVKAALPEENLFVTQKIPRKEALKHLEESHLVWHPEWKGYVGMYSGKIFEYLGAKRHILIAPSVGDVIDQLLQETNSGKSFRTSEEIAAFIREKYDEWKTNGVIRYDGNNEAIAFYSRENQSRRLLDVIEKYS